MARLNNTGNPPAARTSLTLPAAAQTAAASASTSTAGNEQAASTTRSVRRRLTGHNPAAASTSAAGAPTFALGSVGGVGAPATGTAAPSLMSRRGTLPALRVGISRNTYTDDSQTDARQRPGRHDTSALADPTIPIESVLSFVMLRVQLGTANDTDRQVLNLVANYPNNQLGLFAALMQLRAGITNED